jgi:hypothetical protein
MKKNLSIAFLIFSMVFISCDQDFNTIGSDLVGDEHFDFDQYVVQGLKAYSVSTGDVQTNNLPINPLGFYNNPYFGETKANFVTQAALTAVKPDFGTAVKVENVTLYVPYFSTLISTNSNNESTYRLDSIYGTTEDSKMKLNVFENGFYLDSNSSTNQSEIAKYYSDFNTTISNIKKGNDGSGNAIVNGTRLNDSSVPSENDQFYFNKEEVVIYETKFNATSGALEYVDASGTVIYPQTNVAQRVVKQRLKPGIYLTLNKEYFKKRILDANASDLLNNNDFKHYFKGLYFQVENAGQEGAMAMLNFNSAILNINFNSVNSGSTVATSKTFSMKFGTNVGNTVSLQDFTPKSDYANGLLPVNQNQTTGQNANLFVKGGKGSVVYIDVFGDTDVKQLVNGVFVPGANQVPDELEELKLEGWLINDAYLEFYVYKSKMINNSKAQEPERLYLFDATNQKPLIDYIFDTSLSSNSKRSKFIFGGIVERDNDDPKNRKAVKYKIRITQHINNLINGKNITINKNVRLGLCVTENIAFSGNYYFKTPIAFGSGSNIEKLPVASIISQQGVVLHGTGSADTEKRLKLTIHYTKPN